MSSTKTATRKRPEQSSGKVKVHRKEAALSVPAPKKSVKSTPVKPVKAEEGTDFAVFDGEGRVASLSDLSSLIPPAELAGEYIVRTIAPKITDLGVMKKARELQHNILIEGPTGPGKSTSVRAFCSKNRLPYYRVPCNGGAEPRQLFGSWVPTEVQGVLRWQDGPVTALVRKGGVIFLDEVNFMPPKITAVIHQLLDSERSIALLDHEGEVIEAHPGTQVIAAYNPDYEGTRPLNEAFRNRFAFKMVFDYEPKIEHQLCGLDTLHKIADGLRASHKKGDLETPISTNMLIEFEMIVFEFSLDFAISNFVNAFHAEERAAVREVFRIHDTELRKEIDNVEVIDPSSDDDDESVVAS